MTNRKTRVLALALVFPWLCGLAIPAYGGNGDFDGNEILDLADFAAFQGCFTGPGGGPIAGACTPGDHEPDDDIDLDDWAHFLPRFGFRLGAPKIDRLVPAPGTWVVNDQGLTEVLVGFDKPVTIPPDAISIWTVGGGSLTAFTQTYDEALRVLTVLFDSAVRDDRLTMVVDYSIVDVDGQELDGEIPAPANASLPSGNGFRGGQAVFRINILQGDANRDALVDGADLAIIAASNGLCDDDPGFDSNADLNGDGCVNAIDANIAIAAEGRALPAMDNIAPHIAGRTPGADEMFPTSGLTSTVVVLSETVNPASVTASSLFVVKPDGSLQPATSVELGNGNTVATYGFVPALDTEQAYEFNLSNAIADASGLFLSSAPSRVWSASLVALPPVQQTGTAVILGQVFHAETGDPIEGAEITTRLFPAEDGTPNLPPVAVTDATGRFAYTTIPITGGGTFLLQIRKPGFAENLRQIEVMAGRCWRADDATLNPITPPVIVTVDKGAMLADQTGEVTLEIPPGALQRDSSIGITILASHEAIRDDLPQLVGTAGTFIDIAGVFGEETNMPVTLRIPNQYNLPLGTELRFGKIDHNTLAWSDLETDPETDPGIGVGVVKLDGKGGALIEVKFNHFCTVCTGYCLPFSPPSPSPLSPTPTPPPPCTAQCCPSPSGGGGGAGGGGDVPGNSSIRKSEGYLWETISLPAFTEMGRRWGVNLGYFSGAASPSVTLRGHTEFNSTRPVERTIFEFNIEGVTTTAAYDFSENNQQHNATFIWDGRNGLGRLMPTGSYLYRIMATSLNAETSVALTDVFGGTPTQILGGVTYPGLTPISSDPIEDRVVLVNLTDSPYGAGWSVVNEQRLNFDPDGCVVLVTNNADWRLFVPDPNDDDHFVSPAGDFTELVRNPDGTYTRTTPDGVEHTFTPLGRIDRIVDRYDHTVQYSYDSGLLTGIISPTGYGVTLEYESGKLSRITDSAGRETLIEINASGDLVAITDAVGSTRTFDYDAEHRLVAQVDARGTRSEYTYTNGRVTEATTTDIDGTTLLRTRQLAPSALIGEMGAALAEGLGTLVDPIPVVENRIDIYTDGAGQRWTQETAPDGLAIARIDPLDRRTLLSLDANRLVVAVTRPNGSVTNFEYDDKGNRTTIHELANDAISRFEYDGPFFQISKTTNPLGEEVLFDYDPSGNLSSVTVPSIPMSFGFEYTDPAFPSLPTRIVNPLGDAIDVTYQAKGNPAFLEDSLGRVSAIEYEAQTGNVTKVIDPDLKETLLTSDANNRITEIIDPAGGLTRVSYEDQGCGCASADITKVTYPNDTTLNFTYDGLGRRLANIDQLGNASTVVYDPEGRVVESRNRNNEIMVFAYDAAGQLVGKTFPDGSLASFAYSDLGQITSAANDAVQLEVVYDPLGRAIQTVQTFSANPDSPLPPFPSVLDYVYDLAGRRSSLTDRTGATDYSYDALGRVTTITNPQLDAWAFGYEGLNLSEILAPNSTRTRFTHDAAQQLTAVDHENVDGTSLLAISYPAFDGAGNALEQQIASSTGTWDMSYVYDALDRLVEAGFSGLTDATPAVATSVFDDANRLLDDGSFSYTYDAQGRLRSKQEQGSSLTSLFEYDAEGQLRRFSQVMDSGEPLTVVEALYAYDAVGRRVEKVVNGQATRYRYDSVNLLHESSGAGVLQRAYTNRPGVDRPLAMVDSAAASTLYYHQDRLGSVVGLTDGDGSLVQEYVYDAYGTVVYEKNPAVRQSFSYTGKMRDYESGAYYFRARYYDPRVGRFDREDPIMSIGRDMNFYNYVATNPINFVDPDGRQLTRPFVNPDRGEFWGGVGSIGGGVATVGGAIIAIGVVGAATTLAAPVFIIGGGLVVIGTAFAVAGDVIGGIESAFPGVADELFGPQDANQPPQSAPDGGQNCPGGP